MTICFCLTRNIYDKASVAAWSILRHNPDALIIIMAEDDEIEWAKGDNFKVVNISSTKDGYKKENSDKMWTYMAMTRLQLHRLLDLDKVLYVDYDIVCNWSLDELWNTDISEYDAAMVKERYDYYNSGVCLMNLKRLKEGNGDKALAAEPRLKLTYPDQDLINRYWDIKEIDVKYNMGLCTSKDGNPWDAVIYHYMGLNKPWNHRGGRYELWWKERMLKTFYGAQ